MTKQQRKTVSSKAIRRTAPLAITKSAMALRTPTTPRELREFLLAGLALDIPDRGLVPGNDAPFSYLAHAFFEGRFTPQPGPSAVLRRAAPADCVVWANRGGGKTFLGAVASMLDLVFKPGIEIRILGGSLEQSQRMHEYLRRLFESPCVAPLVDGKITERRLALINGSRAQVLAQSQTSVRGTRVQKVRCDEAELFEPEVWEAAQLTTRSMRLAGPWGPWVRGAVEALSTMHKPFGLMWNIVGGASHEERSALRAHEPAISDASGADQRTEPPAGSHASAEQANGFSGPQPGPPDVAGSSNTKRVLFRWGVVDVLSVCGPEHQCRQCALHPECNGRAKMRDAAALHPVVRRACATQRRGESELAHVSPGHVSIDDAIRMKSRVSESVWQSEMLCLRPRRTDCVYPEFDAAVHVGEWSLEAARETDASGASPKRITWLAGMDFGFRSPTVVLVAWLDNVYEAGGAEPAHAALHIEAEHIQSEWTIHQHIKHIQDGVGLGLPKPAWIGVDPAGNQRSEQTGLSAVTAMRKAGLVVRSRRFELHEGIELVRARLRPAGGAHGSSPTLYIHSRCKRLIEAMHRYHYPEDRPESLDPVKDGFDHAADALRYLMVNLDRPHKTTHTTYL
ncbi:MAG: hypothetical protein H7210_01960 [Pyrinomonadaceae bacterium]|nr:hypothetical protein [Phycisphaerales bacterium]